jgi:hypothetical protein
MQNATTSNAGIPATTGADVRNLYQRIRDVMGEIGYVQRDKRTTGGAIYKYVSHDAVVRHVRGALIKHGVVALASVVPDSIRQDGNRTQAITELRLVNADNPSESITLYGLGFGIDSQDKGPGKAASYGKKYALIQAFLLETGDDPEQDNIEHEPAPTPATESKQEPKREAAQAENPTRKHELKIACLQIGAPLTAVTEYLQHHTGQTSFDALDDETQEAIVTDWEDKAQMVARLKAEGVPYERMFEACRETTDATLPSIHCATATIWRRWLTEAKAE